MAVGTWQTDYPMGTRIQWTGIRPMAIGTRHLGDNLDAKATCSGQQKIIKTQRTGIRLMAAGAQ